MNLVLTLINILFQIIFKFFNKIRSRDHQNNITTLHVNYTSEGSLKFNSLDLLVNLSFFFQYSQLIQLFEFFLTGIFYLLYKDAIYFLASRKRERSQVFFKSNSVDIDFSLKLSHVPPKYTYLTPNIRQITSRESTSALSLKFYSLY